VEEAGTAPEVLDRVGAEDWDLLILDLNMPGRGGLDLLGDIRRDRPRLPVLVLSMYPEDQFAMRALRAGASGYVTKESAPEELITAVNKIVKGGRYVSGALAERMAISLGPEADRPPHEALSDREFQVLRLIVREDGLADRRRAEPQRQDDQHLPHSHPREDGDDDERRADGLRRPRRARGLTP